MTADPIRITSLKAPPPGFTWDLEEREREQAARTSDLKFHLPKIERTAATPSVAPVEPERPARNEADAWTREQNALLYDLAGMVRADEIARRVSEVGPLRTEASVRGQARALGYPLRKRWKRLYRWSRWTAPEEQLLRDLAGTVELDEIVRRLNARFGTTRRMEGVRHRMSQLGLSARLRDLIPQHRVLILLGVGKPRLHVWIEAGWLRVAREHTGQGSDLLFHMKDLEAFVREHPEQLRGRTLSPGPLRAAADMANRRDRWFTVAEAATALGLHPDTVWTKCRAGRVPGVEKVGRQYRIPFAALDSIRVRPSYRRSNGAGGNP